MFQFLFRLSLKMITDWKKEMLLVILGIIISSCAVIKFTDSITNFDHYYFYYGLNGTTEERIFRENRIHFSFQDSENLDNVIEQLKRQEGIRNVMLKGNAQIASGHDFAVAFYNSMPILSKHDNSIGTTPEQVRDGTIVLSYGTLFDLRGGMPSDPEDGVVITSEEIQEKSPYTLFYPCGHQFPMAGRFYQVVAENVNFEDNLISLHDFMELDREGKMFDVELVYIYDDGFTESQMAQTEELIRSIKPWEHTYKEEPDNTLSISDYLDFMSDLIIGVILAVLNALFIYQSVLKRRIPSYSILKILGLKNIRLWTMIMLEMLILFTMSFIVSVILFFIYCSITGELIYNLRYSVGYSFCLLLVIYILLSMIMTIRLVRKQPFEVFADNR